MSIVNALVIVVFFAVGPGMIEHDFSVAKICVCIYRTKLFVHKYIPSCRDVCSKFNYNKQRFFKTGFVNKCKDDGCCLPLRLVSRAA